MDTDHIIPWSLYLGLYSTHFSNLFYLLKTSTWTNSLGIKARSQKTTMLKLHVNLFPFFSVHRSQRPDPTLQLPAKCCSDFCSLWTWLKKSMQGAKGHILPKHQLPVEPRQTCRCQHTRKWSNQLLLKSFLSTMSIPTHPWLSKPAPQTTPLWKKKINKPLTLVTAFINK